MSVYLYRIKCVGTSHDINCEYGHFPCTRLAYIPGSPWKVGIVEGLIHIESETDPQHDILVLRMVDYGMDGRTFWHSKGWSYESADGTDTFLLLGCQDSRPIDS